MGGGAVQIAYIHGIGDEWNSATIRSDEWFEKRFHFLADGGYGVGSPERLADLAPDHSALTVTAVGPDIAAVRGDNHGDIAVFSIRHGHGTCGIGQVAVDDVIRKQLVGLVQGSSDSAEAEGPEERKRSAIAYNGIGKIVILNRAPSGPGPLGHDNDPMPRLHVLVGKRGDNDLHAPQFG